MNKRLVTVFAFALAVAGCTSFALYRLILSHAQAPGEPAGNVKVVVATRDLQVGDLLKPGDIQEMTISGPLAAATVKTTADAVDRGVIAAIYQNEPVLGTRLAPRGAGAGLAALIPVGMRAAALPVNEVVGLAGFVSPGMRVDVLITGGAAQNGGQAGTFCRTVLQNIQVLSAGQKIERNIEGKPESAQVVNLLVTPDQAETLDLASGETKVQLVLRNPLDTKDSVTSGLSLAKLMGLRDEPVPVQVAVNRAPLRAPRALTPPREPEMATVEVFSGMKRSEQKFETGSK